MMVRGGMEPCGVSVWARCVCKEDGVDFFMGEFAAVASVRVGRGDGGFLVASTS